MNNAQNKKSPKIWVLVIGQLGFA